METFSYKAVDASGKDVKGAVEAESRDEAARKIKEQGFTPVSIAKQGALDKDVNVSFLGKKKISFQEKRGNEKKSPKGFSDARRVVP